MIKENKKRYISKIPQKFLPWIILGGTIFFGFIFYTNEKLGLSKGISSIILYLAFSFFSLYYTYWKLLRKNKQKLIYYFIEFLIVIFGIYGIILIKDSLENFWIRDNLISLSILILIFTALITLLHLKEKFKPQQHLNP